MKGLLSIAPRSPYDDRIAGVLDPFQRRVAATPPGVCPIAVQLALLEVGGAQTCGKCVPCRDGIPQLVRLLRTVLDCEAEESTLQAIRTLRPSSGIPATAPSAMRPPRGCLKVSIRLPTSIWRT